MRNKIFNLLCVFCALALNSYAQEKQDDKDFYATIATFSQIGMTDRPMETIEPVDLPVSKKLSWGNSRAYFFKPLKKITNQKELLDGLAELKNKYSIYLRDIAPALLPVKEEIRVEKMQFRYETQADQKDFNRLVSGGGEWKTIDMPYYHGPQGPSTAWYRSEINISSEMFNKPSLMLHFNGSDYYTDAYINGHHVGYHEGMLDEFEFNIKKYARPGKNTLLVKVRNDYSMLGGEGKPRFWGNKLSASNCPGWDDPMSGWSCCPTGYGIYQDVYIVGKGEPYIADVFCRPLIEHDAVELWVEVDLEDGTQASEFLIKYSLFGQNFETTVEKDKKKQIRVEGGRVLNRTIVKIPKEQLRLWTPESPWLYQMQVTLASKDGKVLLDSRKQQFGMRSFVIDKNSTPKGRMYLNGKEVRLRGTNTMGFLQQRVMKHDWNGLTDDLLMSKLTNMNFIRTTQRIMPKEVYEYADRVGMMMQADMPLFAYINQKQYPEILKQASGIERVLRNHPSVILMSYLNEPMAEVKAHAVSRYAYERMFDALDVVVHNENPDRAVKYIDGDYQAPSNGYPDNHCYNIWYDEHVISLEKMCRGAWMPISKGWMYGCGEFGAEGLDPVDLMKRRYPKEWLKTEPDASWSPKYMRGIYAGEQTYEKHWNWFETETSMEDWVKASQTHQKWGVQKVARAFRRMPRMNSFAVHLFIDAWPNGWMKAIMDCERIAKPAWFAYRDALTPLAVQVETERTSFYSKELYNFQVWICNDTHDNPLCELRYTLELNGKVINSGKAEASVPVVRDAVLFQGFLPVKMPSVSKRSNLTVRVALIDKNSKQVLHEDVSDCTLYPAEKEYPTKRIYLVGNDPDCISFQRAFGLKNTVTNGKVLPSDLIVVATADVSSDKIHEIESNVANGANVLVLEKALESTNLIKALGIKAVKRSDSWILFRNRTHLWVKGTGSRDLMYPYSSILKTPERYYFSSFEADGFTPVLTHTGKLVLAEKNAGKGRWIICGLSLKGKLESNPSLAKIFKNVL